MPSSAAFVVRWWPLAVLGTAWRLDCAFWRLTALLCAWRARERSPFLALASSSSFCSSGSSVSPLADCTTVPTPLQQAPSRPYGETIGHNSAFGHTVEGRVTACGAPLRTRTPFGKVQCGGNDVQA
jgi:hypothetical protein